MNQEPELRVTSADEWSRLRREGELVELPSGFVARLRPVSIDELLELDQIPDELMAVAMDVTEKKILEAFQANDADAMAEETEKMVDYLKIVLRNAFLEPKVSGELEPSEPGTISYYDVEEADKRFVVNWARSPQRRLHRFRQEQESPLVDLHAGEDEPEKAIGDT